VLRKGAVDAVDGFEVGLAGRVTWRINRGTESGSFALLFTLHEGYDSMASCVGDIFGVWLG